MVKEDSILTYKIILTWIDGTQKIGRVIERKYGTDGKLIERGNTNHILNSHEYVVQYLDGTEETIKYEKVVENIYNKIDEAGN